MKTIVAIITLLVCAFLLMHFKHGEILDHFNPFLSSKEYYVKIHDQGTFIEKIRDPEEETVETYNKWEYVVTGIDENGKKEKLRFSSIHKLKEGTYIKIHSKGRSDVSWDEIGTDDVPNGIKKDVN